jgi:hypothetical protein
MKKYVFWLLLIVAVVLSFKIGRILIVDFHRLTNYGLGYLTGLLILFLMDGFFLVLLWINIYRKKASTADSGNDASSREIS